MGGSESWLKSLISHKKSNPDDREKVGKRSNKWKLWRSSSSIDSGLLVKRGQVAASEPSDFTASAVNDVYTAAMVTLIRAPPKNFLIVRKEWAAIRIQTAFRALLARRALRALKSLVRLQAIVRGRLVRKQAAMTLKCMQALVRAQAQIKAHRVRISLQGNSLHSKLSDKPPPLKQPQEVKFDSRGNTDDMEVKLQMRKEAALKKSISQQVMPKKQLRAASDLNRWKKDSFSGPMEIHELDKSNSEWSSLEEWWVASEPCEDSNTSSLMSSERKKGKPSSKVKEKSRAKSSKNACGNNTTKRVTTERPQRSISYCSSSSSVSSSTTVEGADETASSAGFGYTQLRFMSPTSSKMAKQRAGIKKIHQKGALSDWMRC